MSFIQHCLILVPIIRFIPHVVVYYRFKDRDLLNYERDIWIKNCNIGYSGLLGFLKLLHILPEYRSLFYFRTDSDWLRIFAKGCNNLFICMSSEQIGRGLMIWHGYSTIIGAKQIGENFQVWQNVTIGNKITGTANRPIIGNNVSICTGAVCLGDIKIGQSTVIGANATVVKDVPENAVVVNQSVRIILKKK